jgi:tRNA (adenine22-N1)-methyltransferase
MLSQRLKSLTKYINKTDNVIDIGCDHALLDIYIIKNNLVDKMIASDIHENALQAGIKNIKMNRLSNKIDTRLGNGLEVLTNKDNINTILISGMGTSTIISILNNDYLKNINKIIIQSNNDHYLLRKTITKMGYYISDEEYLVDKKKHYINIVFVKGDNSYTNDELLYGPILIHNREYLDYVKNKLSDVYKRLPWSKILLKIKQKKEINKINRYIQMT